MKPGTSQQEQQVYEDKQVEVYQERQELLEFGCARVRVVVVIVVILAGWACGGWKRVCQCQTQQLYS